jgi:hypothetical protein
MLAQTPSESSPVDAPPKGQVLFQSHGAPSEASPDEVVPPPTAGVEKMEGTALTDAERSAIRFTAYDLDARFNPSSAGLVMRAGVTVRNDGTVPLQRIAMQISSTLHWESVTLLSAAGPVKAEFDQHLLDTDADHTGRENEVVVALPKALAPGESAQLDTFYAGTIAASDGRLMRIGASSSQALDSDWDAVSAQGIALRGFGNVLWYPVASPQLFLGEGAQLFDAVGAMRLREQDASIHLRLSVEYKGAAPAAAYFCGRRKAFTALPDSGDEPVASGSGIAAAEFAAEPLGFREPNLFTVNEPERMVAPLAAELAAAAPSAASVSSSSHSDDATAQPATIAGSSLLAIVSDDEGTIDALSASAEKIAPLLQQWLGTEPLSSLTVIDHQGQPFEDGPLLVASAAALATPDDGAALTHSLTHAWVQTGQPWIDEGLAQFFALLWTEHEGGREKAIAQLDDLLQPLPLVEPDISPTRAQEPGAAQELPGQVAGQPLIAASAEVFYRRKAAAVWWMLRGLVGDDALTAALETMRQDVPGHESAENAALAFEKVIEHAGPANAKNPVDLRWFFNDWVLHDRGLPDLSITDVTPRSLPMGQGHAAGFLVSVSVRNDGAAEAQIPVTIRSDTYSTTSQLRVPGFSTTAARVVVESAPTEVQVNDGTVPEVRTMFHTVKVSGFKMQP